VLSGAPQTARTFDTWSRQYMSNNISDDGNNVLDDDEGPPYPTQLSGIQITLRLYDPRSKIIRQTTIVKSFKNL
jgi:hypothetical protein